MSLVIYGMASHTSRHISRVIYRVTMWCVTELPIGARTPAEGLWPVRRDNNYANKIQL